MRLSLAVAALACTLVLSMTVVEGTMLERLIVYHFACRDGVSTSNYSDAWYNTTLSNYTTQALANAFFKTIFTALSGCPSTPATYCTCMGPAIPKTPTNNPLKFHWFFLNDENLADLTQILTDFKSVNTLKTVDQIWTTNTNMYLNITSLVAFVIKFDFTPDLIKYYAKTVTAQALITADEERMCFQTYLDTNTDRNNNITATGFKNDPLKQYTQCLGRLITASDKPTLRVMAYLNILPYPEIVSGDLLDYVNYLLDSVGSLPNPRKSVWVFGDPHISSLDEGHQICKFEGRKLCLQTPYMLVYCTAEKVNASIAATVLTKVEVTFSNGNLSMAYTASSDSFDSKFVITSALLNLSTSVWPNAQGGMWLSISAPSTNQRSILDYQSNTTITIGKSTINTRVMLALTIRSRIRSLSGATGLLAEGCDAADTVNPAATRRRRRDAASACTATSSTTTDDDSMPSSLASTICQYDVSTTGDASFATLTTDAVSSLNSLRSADSTFPTNSAHRTAAALSIASFILVAIVNVIFTRLF